MDFEIARNGAEGAVVTLGGRLSFKEMEAFDRMANTLFSDVTPRYVFDLSGVEHIDSAGMGMLLVARKRARESRADMVLARPKAAVRSLLDLAKFNALFAIED